MKLHCSVVKDLYVLYEEDELSLEVRKAVEAHIKDCRECEELYKSQSGFPDDIKEKVDIPLKQLDEKLMLKLKISRLKVIIGLILVVALMGLFSSYSQSRQFLIRDFSKYTKDMYHYKLHSDGLKAHEKSESNINNIYNKTAMELLNNLNNDTELVKRNFNFIEKNEFEDSNFAYSLDLAVGTLVLTLNNRWENGYWSGKDEEVYSRLKSEIDSLDRICIKYHDKLASSKYRIINTKQLKEGYAKINELARVYTKYNKLPEEVSFLTEDQLKEKINSILGQEVKKIELTKTPNLTYNFRVVDRKITPYYGEIDALAGKITQVQGGSLTDKGNSIEVDEAKEKIKEITTKNLGEGFDVDIKYLGININFSSNVNAKVYCFEVQPLYKGYKIFGTIDVKINSSNGEIINYSDIGFRSLTPLAKIEDLKVDIKYSSEEASKMFTTNNKGAYKYESTKFIKSMFLGEYVLVHYYKEQENSMGNPQELYINVTTGREEWPAYVEGMITY